METKLFKTVLAKFRWKFNNYPQKNKFIIRYTNVNPQGQ